MRNVLYKNYLRKIFTIINCWSLVLCSFVTVAEAQHRAPVRISSLVKSDCRGVESNGLDLSIFGKFRNSGAAFDVINENAESESDSEPNFSTSIKLKADATKKIDISVI